MKIKLPHYFLGLFSVLSFNALYAQDFEHLEIASGYNHDVIANGVNLASASTTIGVDNANFAFVSNDFQANSSATPPSYGLPVSGLINSAATTGLSYQLADFSSNNSLRIHGTATPNPVTEGTLTFANQVTATKLYLLTTSGSGTSTISVTIHFTDETTQVITGSTVPDWYNSTVLPVAASGFGRVNRANSVLESPAGNPRMYQLTLNILPENQPKTIEGIHVQKTSTAEGAVNIFAVTAELLPSCPSLINLTSVSGVDNGTVNWELPVIIPSDGYDYYFNTTGVAPDDETEPTGNVASDITTIEMNDLTIGQQYFVWVRSNCGDDDKGSWQQTSFTTGQLSVTYTDGDISTLYNITVNTGSTTTCPGVLSVEVPEGYQIASPATAYNMTAADGAWRAEQRSLLYCTTSNTGETSVYSGNGNSAGVINYSRSNIGIANGLTGTVEFEMRAWRTWGTVGNACSTNYNKVDNNTWTVTITYECVTPDTPEATDQAFCYGATVSELQATTGYEDAEFVWYLTEAGGEPLSADAELEAGTYYVAQRRFTCESERQAVTVTMNNPVAPVADAQTVCYGTTIGELSIETAEGATVHYYATATEDELLTEDQVLETGSYYISQTVNGCASETVEVAVTVTMVNAPDTVTEQYLCEGATAGELYAEADENGTIQWYMDAEGSEPIDAFYVVVDGTYYVSQMVNGCQSEITEITATVNAIPAAPESQGVQEFNNGDTFDALEVSLNEGAVANWYVMDESENYISVGNDTVLEDGATYYVSQTLLGCESEVTAITVNEILSNTSFDFRYLTAYPNPVSDVLTISNNEIITGVTVTNLLGQTVYTKSTNTETVQVNVASLAKGTYIVQIQSEGKSASMKIIKQ